MGAPREVSQIPVVVPELLFREDLDANAKLHIVVALFMQMADENKSSQEKIQGLQDKNERQENDIRDLKTRLDGIRKREVDAELQSFRNWETAKKLLAISPYIGLEVVLLPVSCFALACSVPQIGMPGLVICLVIAKCADESYSSKTKQIEFLTKTIREQMLRDPNITFVEAKDRAEKLNLERIKQEVEEKNREERLRYRPSPVASRYAY